MGGWAFVLALMVGWPLWNWWRERGLQKEYERNPKFSAPETDQLKWAVRHIREDINLLCHLMFIAVARLAASFVVGSAGPKPRAPAILPEL